MSDTTPSTTESAGSAAAYHKFLKDAQLVPAGSYSPFKGWENHARTNVAKAVKEVMAHKPRLVSEMPAVNIKELEELPELADAVVFAVDLVNRDLPAAEMPAAQREALEAEGWTLRKLGLSAGQTLVAAGCFKPEVWDQIQAGRGKLDMARDDSQIAEQFISNWDAVAGKHPLQKSQVLRMAEVGQQLQHIYKPKGSTTGKQVAAETVAAVENRDRLWTLLVKRYDMLWRAGAWLWGRDEVEEHVPALLSREASKSAKKG